MCGRIAGERTVVYRHCRVPADSPRIVNASAVESGRVAAEAAVVY